MSVSFIYQNMSFFYRIDSIDRALPVLVWKCKDLPMVHGEAHSMEHMYEDIKAKLKQYYRNRSLPACDNELLMSEASNGVKSESKTCDTCGLTSAKMESQSTCPDCIIENK